MNPLGSALEQVTAALGSAGIRYAIGGSVASSARSMWRTTMNVDLVAVIQPRTVKPLLRALGPDWYGDEDTACRAMESGSPFNVIQMKLAMKVDIFPAREEFDIRQIERATVMRLGEEQVPLIVTTAEDILLAKLRWYADGGRVSDRQWNDITTLIAVNLDLDWMYVRDWAGRFGVTDLLEKAIADAAG
jgi:hypothetical protein